MRKRLASWIVIAAVAGLLFLGLWRSAPRHVDLMARATRVSGYQAGPSGLVSDYVWLTQSRVKIVGGAVPVLTVETAPLTHEEAQPLPIRQSPRWSINYIARPTNGAPAMKFTNQDGSDAFVFENSGVQAVTLTGDRCAMIELTSPRTPGRFVMVDLTEKHVFRPKLPALANESIKCFNGRDSVLTLDPNSRSYFSINLRTGGRTLLHPAFPAQCNPFEVHASPDGQRLLWYLEVGERRPSLIQRMLIRLGLIGEDRRPTPYLTEGIWVSRGDGSAMREIGEVPCEWAPAGFYMPRWLPDGRHISFLYRHGMYIVPAD